MHEAVHGWYYLNALNQVAGPAYEHEIEQLRADYDFLVWKDGMDEWTLASEFFGEGEGSPNSSLESAGAATKAKPRRQLGRTAKELVFLCRSFIEDGAVTPREAESLRSWIVDHPEVWEDWPANVLCERISHSFADGVVDEHERAELLHIGQAICGDSDGGPKNCDTSLFEPLGTSLEFEGHSFAFMGDFVHGSLVHCKEEVRMRGGLYRGNLCDHPVRYVVVGALGLEEERSAELIAWRSRTKNAAIISEMHWQEALRGYSESLEDEEGETEVEQLNPREFRLPRTVGALGNIIQMESGGGDGPYTVCLKDQTCTCPDFVSRRSQFGIGELRRACTHVCKAIVMKRLVMPPFLEAMLRHRIEVGRGLPIGEWIAWCTLDGFKCFVGANEGGWVNVFAPSRLRSGPGLYADFSYSLYDRRWVYGNRPFMGSRLERFIRHQIRLPMEPGIETS